MLILFSTSLIGQTWKKYKYEDLAMVAYFPEEPSRTMQQVDSELGVLDMHMVMLQPSFSDDNALYGMIRSDYPESFFADADAELYDSVLEGSVEGAVTNVNGDLVSDENITFNGYPGRNIKIKIEGAYIYMRAILINHIMFINQVICETPNDGNDSIERFLESFEILRVKGDE